MISAPSAVEEDPLYRDAALARFYDLDNGWANDLEFCLGLAKSAKTVLDLGCGTGLLAARLAEGREVVGVDPATAMLEIARGRPGGERVAWVQAEAQGLDLGRRFELVVLTGHAFQVFLSDADQAEVLATIARHLAPGGRFVFDSREPAAREWLEWAPEASRRWLDDPELGRVEAWNEAEHDPETEIVTYRTHYRVEASAQVFSAGARIRFTAQAGLAQRVEAAGLEVERWLGDWEGSTYGPGSSEIIPLGRLHP